MKVECNQNERESEYEISVVIPTYNRSDLLQETLESLSYQQLAKSRYEVIVVDDGSSDDTYQMLVPFFSRINLSYIYQEDLGFRAAEARNKGIASAKSDIVLMIDSGMVLPNNLLEKHLDKYKESEVDSLIGFGYGFNEFETLHESELLRLQTEYGYKGIFNYFKETDKFDDCRIKILKDNYASFLKSQYKYLIFWTCHVSVKRSHLMAVGMFDTNFTCWGGEDVELAIRLQKYGSRFDLLFDSIAYHQPHSKDKNAVKASSDQNVKYIKNKHCHIPDGLFDSSWEVGLLKA